MADTLKLDLDPKKLIQSLKDVSDQVKQTAQVVEDSLGKEAPKSIDKMEKAAEDGSSKISSYFRNLGSRVKNDLKSAFDVGSLLGGLKLTNEIGQGIRDVFSLEQAFDRLNARLQLSGKSFLDFKKSVGTVIAGTGQKIEDVLPGVETAAAKGNVKSPADLAEIAKGLGEVRASTGESTTSLADTVVEILKSQGQKVTGESFKATLDALQSTRVAGSFKTANDAGQAIEGLAPYAQKLGLNTRDLGGLSAAASRSGSAGQNILQQLLEKATTAGGQDQLNAVFGTQLFKGGKLDTSAFKNIDQNRFGKYSQQALESSTGLTGANGADLGRFLDSMKSGQGDMAKVTQGSNETAAQFAIATDNLASQFDKFKETTKNVARETGDDLSSAAHALLKGDFKGAMGDVQHAGQTAYENKGTIGAALGATAIAAMLTGSGLRGVLGKIPGVGGALGGIAGGEAAKALGVQPVYVTNASEIGGGGAAAGLATLGSTALGQIGKFAGLGAVAVGGFQAGKALADAGYGSQLDPVIDTIFTKLGVNPKSSAEKDLAEAQARSAARFGGDGNGDSLASAVAKGTEQGMSKAKGTVQLTNPSAVRNRGSSM